MNLSSMLNARKKQQKPVRVGLIGAGKFGSMILSQARHIEGIIISAVAVASSCQRLSALFSILSIFFVVIYNLFLKSNLSVYEKNLIILIC